VSAVGSNRQVWRTLLEQARLRTPECLSLWQVYTIEERELADRISTVIYHSLQWPNPVFVPRDPFQILVWDYTGDLKTGETLCAIEKSLGLLRLSDERWDDLLKCCLGDVVKVLVAEQHSRSDLKTKH
jgi:hypothetical protein